MWPFSHSISIADSGLLEGTADCHSHILPGVDDGHRTMEEAVGTLKAYERFGIREVWLTPHIMEDYPNRTETLRRRFERLFEAYRNASEHCSVTLHLASENMLDPLFLQRLANDDLLPVWDERHLLVETSCYNPPLGLEELLEQIFDKGYIPVLAHPERYQYMTMQDYEELYRKGVKLQLNMLSLVGAYGEEARRKSERLLKRGRYFLSGSDLHRLEAFDKGINIPVGYGIIKELRTLVN